MVTPREDSHNSEADDRELVERARQGDSEEREAAVQILLERYGTRLRQLVARQLSAKLQRKEGISDVVQSVLVQLLEGKTPLREASAWGLIAHIARASCLNRFRRFGQSGMRDASREVELDSAAEDSLGQSLTLGFEPSESHAEAVFETLALLDRLPETLRAFAVLSLRAADSEKATDSAIAEALGVSLRSVGNYRARLWRILHRAWEQCPRCCLETAGVRRTDQVECPRCGATWPEPDEALATNLRSKKSA